MLGCCPEEVGAAGSTFTKNPQSSACCCSPPNDWGWLEDRNPLQDGSGRDDKDRCWKDADMSVSLFIVEEEEFDA